MPIQEMITAAHVKNGLACPSALFCKRKLILQLKMYSEFNHSSEISFFKDIFYVLWPSFGGGLLSLELYLLIYFRSWLV